MSSNIKLLDGGFGQAIINKGLDQIGTLWGCSAYLNQQHHQKVIDTHLDFINAGSKIITTSNFTIRKRRLAQNKLEDKLNDFLKISGKLAQKAVKLSNKKIEIAGSLPTRGETYKSDIFLSDNKVAAKIGRDAFLEPEILTCPLSLPAPKTSNFFMIILLVKLRQFDPCIFLFGLRMKFLELDLL